VNGATLFAAAVGICAPGLPDWTRARAVLRGQAPYIACELPPPQSQLLPPNERRRAPYAVRQAFRAAEDALSGWPHPAERLAAVFASSDADTGIIHRICQTLAGPAPQLSPTDFHNSVHNAAAGYWSIATGARGPSNTICAYDGSFAAGLLEAALLVTREGLDTLLVVYDVPPPAPLYEKRPITLAASTALVLSAEQTPHALGRLRLARTSGAPPSRMADAALETLRLANPALRALPLLRLLARGQVGRVSLEDAADGALDVEVLA
jgi:hypothetical protein